MKFDSESPNQQTCPSQDPETKLIVRCDNPFIRAKDNHFMIGMLNIDDESPKEGKHDHKSHFKIKGSKVMCPPKQNSNVEDTINIDQIGDEHLEALYSAPASGFEMVVKEDFYSDLIVTKAALPEVRDCIEVDPSLIVRDISIDEGLHFPNKSLVEKEEVIPIESSIPVQTLENGILGKSLGEKEQVGPIKSSIYDKTINNERNDSKSVMARSVGSNDSKYTVFDRSMGNVNEDQSAPASVLHNSYHGNGPSVSSFDMLETSNTSAKFTEHIVYPASVTYDDYDGKESINSEDDLRTTKYVACNTSVEDFGNKAVLGSAVHNESDAMVSYVSSIDRQKKLESYELVASNACGMVSSVSSINCKCDLDNKSLVADMSTEIVENQTVPISGVHNDCDGKELHNSSVDSLNELDTYKSVASNVSTEVHNDCDGKELHNSSDDRLNELDTYKSVARNVSTEVHNDCDGKELHNSSVDSLNELHTYKSVASNVSTEVDLNQLPPLPEPVVDLLPVNSSIQDFLIDQKQSVDGQEFQTVSEEPNSVLPGLNFPSEVPASTNGPKEVSANCKVPSGVITFSFDTEEASTSGRDVNRETTDNQKSAVAHNSHGTEEATIDGPSASVRSSSLRFIQEESNLYGPALLSGHNANTGNIPYSGSVSLRSESSTTSTRSFAFPILQSEWNSSPVKMAKADRRQKHRGWKIGLMCCRF